MITHALSILIYIFLGCFFFIIASCLSIPLIRDLNVCGAIFRIYSMLFMPILHWVRLMAYKRSLQFLFHYIFLRSQTSNRSLCFACLLFKKYIYIYMYMNTLVVFDHFVWLNVKLEIWWTSFETLFYLIFILTRRSYSFNIFHLTKNMAVQIFYEVAWSLNKSIVIIPHCAIYLWSTSRA